MILKRLGTTDILLSKLGLGAWPFSSGYDWSNPTLPDVGNVLNTACEQGINWIDTAPIYEGSELSLGKLLKGRRSRFLLAGKCGLTKKGTWPTHDLSPQTITLQLENSLQNLQTDYLDIYQIHYPDPKYPLAAALDVLFRFKKQGKIRAVGVCNVTLTQLQSLSTLPDCVQNEFSLLHPQKGQEVFDFCQANNISFIGYGTLCGGILSGKYTRSPNLRRADARNYFYGCYRGTAFEQAQQYVRRIKDLAARLSVPPSAVAVAWALSHAAVSSVLCGSKTPAQVLDNVGGVALTLTTEDLSFLEQK